MARLRFGLLRRAMTAHEVRKLQNRKKACRDTARSWSSVLEELKMRRKFGSGMASGSAR